MLLVLRARLELESRPSDGKFTSLQQVALQFITAAFTTGCDIRVDPRAELPAKAWPRAEQDVDLWEWRLAQSFKWQIDQHINVLESRSALKMLRCVKVGAFWYPAALNNSA
mgnify:CR=1 FL=1